MSFAVLRRVDWPLVCATLPLALAGLVSMNSFTIDDTYAPRQMVWLLVALITCLIASNIDWRFLRRTSVVVSLYIVSLVVLALLGVFGHIARGAQSWFQLGLFSIQPSDLAKLVVVIILAKYFSRRHIEIAHYRHILVSFGYTLLPLLFVLFQPDFGSAVIIFLIWFGMIVVSGVSKKHLIAVFLIAVGAFMVLWFFVFAPYQKARIISFIHPLADPLGVGYNARQSTIAVGSGQFLGKGVGYGTQSRLQFLPEYQTDFIFAAFAEEWGFIGVIIVFGLFGYVLFRIFSIALRGATNFEIYYGIGLAIFFMAHFIINVGMNIGLLPVTGTTMPFMSYGGSHLVTEFLGLGILMGMRIYARSTHHEDTTKEFLGLERMRDLNS